MVRVERTQEHFQSTEIYKRNSRAIYLVEARNPENGIKSCNSFGLHDSVWQLAQALAAAASASTTKRS